MNVVSFMRISLCCLLLSSCITDAPYKLEWDAYEPEQLSDGWQVEPAVDHGLNDEILRKMLDELHSEEQFFNTKSLLIARNGKLIFESYVQDKGHRDMVGHVQSVTKSLTSLATGIALSEGLIDSLDQPLFTLIPENFPSDDEKRSIRIRDLLTMRSGLDIDNSVFSVKLYVEKPKDPIKYILDLPLYDPPGETYYYRDCDPHLLSHAIASQTGMSLEKYADTHILEPLGITEYYWGADHGGTSMGAHGLHLKPRDMLKLGQLVLNHGSWAGQQLVDSTWIAESTKLQVNTPKDYGWDTGYYWWQVPEWKGFTAWGHGGNFITVLPEYDLVLVMSSMADTNDDLVGSTLDQLEDLIRPLMDSL